MRLFKAGPAIEMVNASFVFLDHGGTLSKVSREHPQIVLDVLGEEGYEFTLEQVEKECRVSEAWWDENQNRLPRGQRRPLLIESNTLLLKGLGVDGARRIAERIQTEWHARAGFRLYPDTLPCLEELKRRGLPMGIISQNLDTNEELRNHALQINHIGDYFSVVATSESMGYDKPDPRLFVEAAKLTGHTPESIVHVGDKIDMDVEGAMAAGMQAILIDRSGTTSRSGPRTISSLSELPLLLFD